MEFDYKDLLRGLVWVEGETIPLMQGSYRHTVTIHCSRQGRQRGQFANGEHPYFAHVQLVNAGGQRITQGVIVVPVLPDGRLLMVVEQRSTLANYPHPQAFQLENSVIGLGEIGSLEFPGGVVDPSDQTFTAAFLRELQEETGVAEQSATLYRRLPLLFPFGSDIALAMQLGVLYLQGISFQRHTASDGGLSVYALTPQEAFHNICTGAISSGQAGLLPWMFYNEVQNLILPSLDAFLALKERHYFGEEKVRIGKT